MAPKVFVLGNGKDVFRSAEEPTFENGDTVNGQNGDDDIDVSGKALTVLGGNGVDALKVRGEGLLAGGPDGNIVDGGRGDDSIEVYGFGNTVNGGQGADFIASEFVQEDLIGQRFYAPGNMLSGGKGIDAFRVVNSSDLIVDITKSPSLVQKDYDQVTGGMVVQGVFDVIVDYAAGERIDIDASERTIVVSLDSYGFDHQHLALADNSYAILDGKYNADGTFLIMAEGGPDCLLVWDEPRGDSSGPLNGYEGALCVLGANPDSLNVV